MDYLVIVNDRYCHVKGSHKLAMLFLFLFCTQAYPILNFTRQNSPKSMISLYYLDFSLLLPPR